MFCTRRVGCCAAGLCLLSAFVLPGRVATAGEWVERFPGGDLSAPAHAILAADLDGPGPAPDALYAGGEFETAGGIATGGVARWDGTRWSPLGGTIPGVVRALALFDADGPGLQAAQLYVGGEFRLTPGGPVTYIARWNGTSWATLGAGTDGPVHALATFDADGAATQARRLIVGGAFQHAGPAAASNIAAYAGAAWSALGDGLDGAVFAIAEHDEDGVGGAPPRLFAGGAFTMSGATSVRRLARWEGSAWAEVGAGVTTGAVLALASYDSDADDPAPALLYVGGSFTSIGAMSAMRLARWDGASLSSVVPVGGAVRSLHVVAPGGLEQAPTLYLGGDFTQIGVFPMNRVARFDGAFFWALTGGGVGNLSVRSVATARLAGSSERLFAAGDFGTAGTVTTGNVAQWDSQTWRALGQGIEGVGSALAEFAPDEAAEPQLVVGGAFLRAAERPARRLAQLGDAGWSEIGGGAAGTILALLAAPAGLFGGDAPSLYVAGAFPQVGSMFTNNIARWQNGAWSAMSNGLGGPVRALTLYDRGDGTGVQLIAGGDFAQPGGLLIERVATWNGSFWLPLGTGIGPAGARVNALAVYDEDGAGVGPPMLFAGGAFSRASAMDTLNLARWDGAFWSPVAGGADGPVYALAVYDDDGAGPHRPALCVAGQFSMVGTLPAANVASWDGQRWSALGGGLTGAAGARVAALAVFDDGAGPELFAGGLFAQAGAASVANLAAWNGAAWRGVDAALNDEVLALGVVTRGPRAGLYATGRFTLAGGYSAERIALRTAAGSGCTLRGDSDGNGAIDFDDIDCFVASLIGEEAWGLCGSTGADFLCASDANGDGVVNFDDIDAFIECLILGACPE